MARSLNLGDLVPALPEVRTSLLLAAVEDEELLQGKLRSDLDEAIGAHVGDTPRHVVLVLVLVSLAVNLDGEEGCLSLRRHSCLPSCFGLPYGCVLPRRAAAWRPPRRVPRCTCSGPATPRGW